MSEELVGKFRVQLEGKDELGNFFDESERGASRLQSALRRVGGALSSFAGRAKSELNSFAGKELGGSIGSQARGVLQYKDALSQLAVTAGGGSEMVKGLDEQVQSVSSSFNQLQGDVTGALQSFVEKTGDLTTARQNLAEYAKVATAASASISDIAQVGADLKEKLDITKQANAFALLVTMSKAGSIEMRDFAKQAPRLFSVASSAGVTGEQGLREIGALTEVYGKYVGGSGANRASRATTAVENTFASIAKKAAKIEAAGIQVNGRDRFDVLFDIIRKTGGDETKLRSIFTQQAMRGILGLANEFKKTGGFGDFEKFKALSADAGVIDRDFATRTKTGESKLRETQIRRAAFINKYLGGVAEFGAEHVDELQAGAYGLGFVGKGLGLLGRTGGAVGGKVGGALASVTAQRVFVVNWPSSFGGGNGTTGGSGGFSNGVKGAITGATGIGLGGSVALLGGVVAAATPLVLAQMSRDKLVDKLVNGTNERDRQAAILRQSSLVRHSGGMVIAKPGESLGSLPPVQNNIKIEVHGDQATVTEGNGTRSKVALERRSASGG